MEIKMTKAGHTDKQGTATIGADLAVVPHMRRLMQSAAHGMAEAKLGIPFSSHRPKLDPPYFLPTLMNCTVVCNGTVPTSLTRRTAAWHKDSRASKAYPPGIEAARHSHRGLIAWPRRKHPSLRRRGPR